ncbi:DUF4244 domain-containing protein [Saccharopolyspora rectivirgula]|uniref:DUF4244 domain-containing protein n=1 Tax=Saccharopolyspora rectivirgula TaxID=28042 RepID=UPI00068702BC|nr:DUF4244 domain-containing protein [Saccharopolyspora rectivirgula]
MRAVGEKGTPFWWRWLVRLRNAVRGEDGMSTAEYAMGTIAAVGFASLLYTVVTSDTVEGALTALIERALQTGGGG